MKRRYILIFLSAFLLIFLFAVLTSHFFPSKGLPPQSWEEIYNDLWWYIIPSLIGAIFCAVWK
jgi:ABC-type dipeptide/oligopeptide/nickel transport system permease component